MRGHSNNVLPSWARKIYLRIWTADILVMQMWRRIFKKDKALFSLSMQYRALKEISYCETYEKLFKENRHKVRAVLELGINEGGSLLMWRDYFPNATILGIDIRDCDALKGEDRIFTLKASQSDISAIAAFIKTTGISKFDIIIDDASHIGCLTKASFWPLFDEFLKPSGHYVIEDWGTGYWPEWPDGRIYQEPDDSREEAEGNFQSHVSGMVGFIKQLVDESHRFAIKDTPNRRPSKFQFLLLKEAMAIAQKAGDDY